MSNGVASVGTSAGSATNTHSGSGSRKRRISQAQAARSMCIPARICRAALLDHWPVLLGLYGGHPGSQLMFLRRCRRPGQPHPRRPTRLDDITGQPLQLLPGAGVGRQCDQPVGQRGHPQPPQTPWLAGRRVRAAAGRTAAPTPPGTARPLHCPHKADATMVAPESPGLRRRIVGRPKFRRGRPSRSRRAPTGRSPPQRTTSNWAAPTSAPASTRSAP